MIRTFTLASTSMRPARTPTGYRDEFRRSSCPLDILNGWLFDQACGTRSRG